MREEALGASELRRPDSRESAPTPSTEVSMATIPDQRPAIVISMRASHLASRPSRAARGPRPVRRCMAVAFAWSSGVG
jgi:hypothetical protein